MRERTVKRTLVIGLIGIGMWAGSYEYGRRLPYVYTADSFEVRTFFVFPTLLALLIWGTCVHRWRETGLSGLQMALRGIKGRWQIVKQVVAGAAGAVLIAGGLAWTSIALPILLTALVASQPFAREVVVTDISAVSTMYDVTVVGVIAQDRIDIRQSAGAMRKNRWRVGESVCIVGRQWYTGALVEWVDRDRKCEDLLHGPRNALSGATLHTAAGVVQTTMP